MIVEYEWEYYMCTSVRVSFKCACECASVSFQCESMITSCKCDCGVRLCILSEIVEYECELYV